MKLAMRLNNAANMTAQKVAKNDNDAGQQGVTEDHQMDELITPTQRPEVKVFGAFFNNDIDMYEFPVDPAGDSMVRPERPATKIFRPDGADDFSAAKQHAAATAASSQQQEVTNDQQAGLTTPPPPSHQ